MALSVYGTMLSDHLCQWERKKREEASNCHAIAKELFWDLNYLNRGRVKNNLEIIEMPFQPTLKDKAGPIPTYARFY